MVLDPNNSSLYPYNNKLQIEGNVKMSWLNFNDSLNTIKGQLSSLANGVLTDNIVKDAGKHHLNCLFKMLLRSLFLNKT